MEIERYMLATRDAPPSQKRDKIITISLIHKTDERFADLHSQLYV